MSESIYDIIKLGERAWRIEENGVRMFLFEGDEQALLVDTGFGSGDLKAVVEKLTQKPLFVVHTHADGDHIGCDGQFETVRMHPAEYAHYEAHEQPKAEIIPLQDGDIIDLGGQKFAVILIPGHSTGSIALLDRENRLLVAGDSISEAPIFMFGQFRNFQAYIASLKRLSAMSGCFDTIYPSHGPFPAGKETIELLIAAAYSVMNGEVPGQDPPFDIPAKMYITGGVGFFC